MVGERRKSKGSPDMEGSSQLVPVSPRRHHHDNQHYLIHQPEAEKPG